MAGMHPNALRDPHIPPDGKTQIRRNVPRRAFCGICTSTTQALKIVCRCCMSQTHQNALRDPMPLDAKTQVQRNVSHFLWKLHRAHPSFKNSVPMFRAPDAPECTT
jgi:hypothetical protein